MSAIGQRRIFPPQRRKSEVVIELAFGVEPPALEAAKKDYHECYGEVPAARLVKRLFCGW